MSYSLQPNAALRARAPVGDVHSSRIAIVPSTDGCPRVAEDNGSDHEHGLPVFGEREGAAGSLAHGVSIFPSDAVKRRAVSWNGGRSEVVQLISPTRIEFGFRAPCHLLIAYEQCRRNDGETFVEGLPSSKLRDVRRRLSFVPAGHEYREWQQARTPRRIAYFYFEPRHMLCPAATGSMATPLAPLLFFDDIVLWEWAKKAADVVESDAADHRYCEALGLVLAHELAARCSNLPARGGLAPWQQRIVTDYIEEHLEERISLATLAALARLSVYHFCRAFKRSFGLPPHHYHLVRRVELAKLLLAKPGRSVTEIGVRVGFSETSSFVATFRRIAGSTPTAYRRSTV